MTYREREYQCLSNIPVTPLVSVFWGLCVASWWHPRQANDSVASGRREKPQLYKFVCVAVNSLVSMIEVGRLYKYG